MLCRSLGMPSRNDGPPSIWDTHGISGNVFANPTASSSAPHPQESNPWVSNVSEHTSPHLMSESQTSVQDPRCQSGPSARNSFVPSEGRFSKNYGADEQRLQIRILIVANSLHQRRLLVWKIRFKTEVCTCSQLPTEAMLWVKEMDMVESVDDPKTSCFIGGIRTPDFEVFDASIASALNRIIQNTRFKKKVSLDGQKAQKEDRFLRGRQIAHLIYEYFQWAEAMLSPSSRVDPKISGVPHTCWEGFHVDSSLTHSVFVHFVESWTCQVCDRGTGCFVSRFQGLTVRGHPRAVARSWSRCAMPLPVHICVSCILVRHACWLITLTFG